METIDIHVARLQERVGALQTTVSDIQTDQKAQNTKLDQLLAADQQRRGARAVTKVLVGLVTSGGFLGWLYEHFSK